MNLKINAIIKSNNLQVEGITTQRHNGNVEMNISISTGSNEGYYVSITNQQDTFNLRLHNKNEALKTLGCMLGLLPNN